MKWMWLVMNKIVLLIFILSASAHAVPPSNLSGATVGAGTGVVEVNSGLVSNSAVTTDLPEGTNLYYTDVRADARITNAFSNPVTVTGRFTVANGHFRSTQSTAPTATVQGNAGTGASCSVNNATDTAGQVAITTGTVGISTGAYCVVNLNIAYGVAPICVLTPANSTLSTNVYVTSSTTDFTVNFAVAGGISSTYILNYHCIETQ